MKYELLFEDLFDYEGKPSKKNWNIEVAGHGGGNNEAQYYVEKEDTVFVKDGMLHIVAKKEKYEDKEYTSAKLHTFGKHSIRYGKVEVEAKLPKGLGTWPAIWMLPESFKNGNGWPECGEIDIMEHIGRMQDTIHFTLHTGTYNFRNNDSQYTTVKDIEGVSDQFYTYGIEWDEEQILFTVDGVTCARHYKGEKEDASEGGWPFDQPFYLIINFAVGGHWGGTIDETAFPAVMNVKSVRVYKKN